MMREDDTTPEEIAICRSGARKILQSFAATLSDALESKDRFKEGLISRDDVQRIIEEQKISDLQPVEVNLLMKLADRGSKGYIVIDRFIDRL
jgi:Ca2+-binding EF-hand superfamily protein